MRRVVWSPDAASDLDELCRYIADFNPAAAIRFSIRLRAAADSLSEFAELGRPGPLDTRELAVVKPYLVRYAVVGDEVLVISIRHGARRPKP
ncbi:type II toxin-antitoxin system RelE/ParE family toxin [Brevundimonas sp.]|uniref:type II toxin-antitoxin system RelE/ParE family toxin n=1 Tax=Brevundimonas sp. TaxID=1871086 RepID=UPI0039E4B678